MTETRTCIKCKEEYEPQYLEAMGIRMLKGDSNCPKCCKKIWAEMMAKEKADKEKEIRTERQSRIASSGIPPRFLTESFSSFDKGWQDKALAFCKKYADNFPTDKRPVDCPSLYLWSHHSWGVGKTHLSCSIARRIFERWIGGGRSCPQIFFVSEPDLFRQIQATYSFSREEGQVRDSEDDIIRKLTHCDLLILDDVGKERRKDLQFIQRTLFGLIDGRYKLKLPIVLTANVNADGLKAHLQDASFDRVFSMIGGKSVCMDGKSYRRELGR